MSQSLNPPPPPTDPPALTTQGLCSLHAYTAPSCSFFLALCLRKNIYSLVMFNELCNTHLMMRGGKLHCFQALNRKSNILMMWYTFYFVKCCNIELVDFRKRKKKTKNKKLSRHVSYICDSDIMVNK